MNDKSSRSISQRLARAKSTELKLEIADEWSLAFRKELEAVIKQLELLKRHDSLSEMDLVSIDNITSSIKKIAVRKVGALKNIFSNLVN